MLEMSGFSILNVRDVIWMDLKHNRYIQDMGTELNGDCISCLQNLEAKKFKMKNQKLKN